MFAFFPITPCGIKSAPEHDGLHYVFYSSGCQFRNSCYYCITESERGHWTVLVEGCIDLCQGQDTDNSHRYYVNFEVEGCKFEIAHFSCRHEIKCPTFGVLFL